MSWQSSMHLLGKRPSLTAILVSLTVFLNSNRLENRSVPRDRARALRRAVLGLGILGMAAGCTTPETFSGYRETVASFETATDETRSATLGYIRNLNAYERQLELARLRADPKRELVVIDLTEPLFEPEAIRVRALAFATISDYTTHLADLADSEAPNRWRLSAESLKSSAEAFASTLSDAESTDTAAAALSEASGPLSQLVGLLGEDYLNWKRERALSKTVETAAPAITRLSTLLKRDVETVIFQRTRDLNEPLIDTAAAYKRLQDEMPLTPAQERRRQELLDELEETIKANAETRGTLEAMRDALSDFDKAHNALVAYAKSAEGANLAALKLAVRRYRQVAKELYEGYKALNSEESETTT